MIRQATIAELHALVPCAVEYTNQIPEMEFNAEHWLPFWSRMLTSGNGVVFMDWKDEKSIYGGIGGIKAPCPLSGRLTAVEMFWYVHPEFRGNGLKLYLKFKQWAKENNCKRLAMVYLPCSMPEKLKRFFEEREKMSLVEMHYEVAL
jgi:hypothetical protein